MPAPLFIPKPICNVCEHEVDTMLMVHNQLKRCCVVLVTCHGQSERFEIEDVILAKYERDVIEVGRAFLKHKAALPPKP